MNQLEIVAQETQEFKKKVQEKSKWSIRKLLGEYMETRKNMQAGYPS